MKNETVARICLYIYRHTDTHTYHKDEPVDEEAEDAKEEGDPQAVEAVVGRREESVCVCVCVCAYMHVRNYKMCRGVRDGVDSD